MFIFIFEQVVVIKIFEKMIALWSYKRDDFFDRSWEVDFISKNTIFSLMERKNIWLL